MVQIPAQNLYDRMSFTIPEDLLEPAITPRVLMSEPEVRQQGDH